MSFLQVLQGPEKILSLKLAKALYKIGRSPTSDIILDDISVSRDHALLIQKEGEWWFEDISRNGVQFADQSFASSRIKLKDFETLTITRNLKLVVAPFLEAADTKTLFIGRQPTQIMTLDADAKKLRLRRALIEVVSGAKAQRLEIPPHGLSIGSHTSNDLTLDSASVSRFHARISLEGNDFVLTDLQSTNGTSVNDIRGSRSFLQSASRIRIGECELKFLLEWEDRELTPSASNRLMDLVSDDEKMRSLFSLIEIVAPTDTSVIINGETGTGKELVARAVHHLSAREQKAFIALNCAALPANLIESELFGHEKGSFTGAMQTHIGAFEAADGGTLFLDEVGELDLAVQAKLLRVLETSEVRRVGSAKPFRVSVRIVAATHRKLKEEVKAGRFREDLYYRLHICPIEIPPLRDRAGDIPLLAAELLSQLGSKHRLSDETLQLLKGYAFPGNIRELKNLLQRALIEFQRDRMTSPTKDLVLEPKHFADLSTDQKLGALEEAETAHREEILELLRHYDFNQSKAAKAKGIPISTFNDWVRRYNIEKPKTRMKP